MTEWDPHSPGTAHQDFLRPSGLEHSLSPTDLPMLSAPSVSYAAPSERKKNSTELVRIVETRQKANICEDLKPLGSAALIISLPKVI